MVSSSRFASALLALAFTSSAPAVAAPPAIAQCGGAIVGVSIPVNSQNQSCFPLNDSVWSAHAPPFPLDVNKGIGNIVRMPPPSGIDTASLHDSGISIYIAPNVPDPTRAVVTYEFDQPVIVDQVEIVQHTNGTTKIEGFVGNSLASLTSIGTVLGPKGDVTGPLMFTEAESNVFAFGNSVPGTFFQFVIRKTSHFEGYALYRAFPRTSAGAYIQPAQGSTSPAVDSVQGVHAAKSGSVSIAGSCLMMVTDATVAGLPASILGQSSTSILLSVAPGIPGAFDLELNYPTGTVAKPAAVKRYPVLDVHSTGIGGHAMVAIENGGTGVFLLAFGTGSLTTPLPLGPEIYYGLLIDPALPYVVQTSGAFSGTGAVQLVYSIPNEPSWAGLTVPWQAWCTDGFFFPANPASFSNLTQVVLN